MVGKEYSKNTYEIDVQNGKKNYIIDPDSGINNNGNEF